MCSKRDVAAYLEKRGEPLQAETYAQENQGGDGHEDYPAIEDKRQNSGFWKEHQVSAPKKRFYAKVFIFLTHILIIYASCLTCWGKESQRYGSEPEENLACACEG